MKKTLNVYIGSMPFVLEEDAYNMLRSYLDELSARIDPQLRVETVNDVEMRIADLFTEILASPRQVITTEHIKRVTGIIGNADDFGEPFADHGNYRAGTEYDHRTDETGRKVLRRSSTNMAIGGVCGGIAEFLNVDAVFVRVIAIIVMFFSIGTAVIIYLLLWMILPVE